MIARGGWVNWPVLASGPENLKIRSVKLPCKFDTGGGFVSFTWGKSDFFVISAFGICIYILYMVYQYM